MKRRRFLQAVTGLGAAAAAPAMIPRIVLGTQDTPSANERIGVAGIGVGRRGMQVFAGTPDLARVVAIADVNVPRAEQNAARYNAAAYKDYRELLERKDVDAIITATPDHWRAIVCIHAAQAGKDIYAEKPMTLTIHEGRQIVKAVQKNGCIFQTGAQQRSMAANRLACEIVRNGRIGKVHAVIAANYPSPWECDFPGQPVPEGLDWDMWCGPAPVVPYHNDIYTPRANPGWISFRPYSGGEMTGWGAHGLDQIQWALGKDDTGPVEIWTQGPEFNPPTYTEPESRARGEEICKKPMVFFKYADGVVVKLDNGPGGGAIFIGDKGRITIDRARFKVEPKELGEPPYDDFEIRLYKSDNHVLNWLECIKSREQPVSHEEVGHRSTTLCHLGNIARWVGRPLKWDPEKEQFDDDEANGLLDRERRKPYVLPEV